MSVRRVGKLALYLRTLRHLRSGQIAARVLQKLPRPQPSRSPAPALRDVEGRWTPPVTRRAAVLAPDRFAFLNRETTLNFPGGWNDTALPKLWLYNLHYFDDLGGSPDKDHARLCVGLAQRWIAENPPVVGNGWEPYPLSLRIVNWLKFSLSHGSLPAGMKESLAVQVRALEQRVEWHILANHIFANAKALTFAGLCFGGEEGARWLRKGLQILDREIAEQILPDGGHFERSPMYHAIILEDLLDLINASAAFPGLLGERASVWKALAGRMLSWLAAMSHADGDIAFFNDCALGIAPRLAELSAYAARAGVSNLPSPATQVIDLAESGYVRVNLEPFSLIFDAAPVGPDYQPGHAHADTLSFELSVLTRRVIVNSAVSTYEANALRASERATSAHNTVEIGGRSSSEVWSAFRVARRARVSRRSISWPGEDLLLEASHDGYRRPGGPGLVTRSISMSPDRVVITDRVEGVVSEARARLRFSPGLVVSLDATGLSGVVSENGKAILTWKSSAPGRLAQISHATAFNRSDPTVELQLDFAGPTMSVALKRAD